MGATSFHIEAEGYTASEAYAHLVDRAKFEHGADYYNGTISTCDRLDFRGINTKVFTKTELKKAKKVMEAEDNGKKRVATCIDCGVVSYTLRLVSRQATHKEPPKYLVKYIVHGSYLNDEEFNTKKEADEYLKKSLLKSGQTYGFVYKKKILVSGTERVTDMKITEKVYKSRPHPKNMKDKILLEKHHYLFYGWAAC
jgi:hypothetical protein